MKPLFALILGIFLFGSALPIVSAGMLPGGWEVPALIEGQNQLPKPKGETGLAMLRNLVIDNIAVTFRYLLISVTILFFSYNVIALVLGSGESKELDTTKKNIGYSILGFAVIGLAEGVAQTFDPAQHAQTIVDVGGIWTNFQKPINYLMLAAGALAVLSLAVSAFHLAVSHGAKEVVDKEKKNITWAIGGLIAILLIETVVTKIVFPAGATGLGTAQIAVAAIEFVGLLSYFLIFVGAAAVLSFIVGGVLYFTAMGDDDGVKNAQKIMKTSIIGLIVILISYSFVATFAQ